MPSWRDRILEEFAPSSFRLTLVADPDNLLLEEIIQQQIHGLGYELLDFDDPVAFRFTFESKFQSSWDKREVSKTAAIVRYKNNLNSLPHDLLARGRSLSFTLSSIFPNLSYRVISELNRSDLDKLYQSYLLEEPQQMGENATKDFVLRHLWRFAPEFIKEPADFLQLVLQQHLLSGERMPPELEERMILVLRQSAWLSEWPVDLMIQSREFCYSFLQERWPLFLTKLAQTKIKGVKDDQSAYAIKLPGPQDVPFGHDGLRVHIDTLFLDGRLKAINHPSEIALKETWVNVGLKWDPEEDRIRRLVGLLENLKETIPENETSYHTWLSFALRWAEVSALRYEIEEARLGCLVDEISDLTQIIEVAFFRWINDRFGTLYNQPAIPPVMLHHVPRLLAKHLDTSATTKVALLVIDGLSLSQWVLLRDEISAQRPNITSNDHAVFAWIPTITSVSRQSIFAGNPPFYFPSSINTTDREPTLWIQFWAGQGLERSQVAYVKNIGSLESLPLVEQKVSDPRVRVVGVVINKIDDIMHGMQTGMRGMHSQVKLWAKEGVFARLLDILNEHDFSVFLTSDHGNIEAIGIGQITEGSVADIKGQRVRVYPSQELRSRIKVEFPESIEWPSSRGLPSDYLALIAPGRSAFVLKGDRPIVHGGISLEELVVPFVQLESRHVTQQ